MSIVRTNFFKPQVQITRSGDTPTYLPGAVYNNGVETTMSEFIISNFKDKPTKLIGGVASLTLTASTEPTLDLFLFSSGFTINTDKKLLSLNDNELKFYLGRIRFSTGNWVQFSGKTICDGTLTNPIILKPVTSDIKIFGVHVVQNSYVANASEILRTSLDVSEV